LAAVGGNWVQFGEYLLVREELDAVDAVTVEEVNALLQEYPLTVNTTVAVGPLERIAAPQ
jgi:predicted Zn-dependent peptidase